MKMNNFKNIRELYGATQEEIATAIGVNRVTVANWENDSSKASKGNLERLSIFYGIGPEYFYEVELDEIPKQMIINTAKKAKNIEETSNGNRKKEEEFHKMFSDISFEEALAKYMFSMKMLLATADDGEIEKLEQAAMINKKIGARLDAIIAIRKQEIESGEPTLFDLIDGLKNNE